MLIIENTGRIWHLGELVPPAMHERVVVVQLDGDELRLLIDAMQKTRAESGIVYRKANGFVVKGMEDQF